MSFFSILAMDGLSVTMHSACDQHLFNGIHFPNNGSHCYKEDEKVNHVFFNFDFDMEVWKWFCA